MKSLPRLGILMLDTQFPRIPGDVGHPASFDFDVRYSIVEGATPDAIVRSDSRPWIDSFARAGQALVAEGCIGLATTCGFLTLAREDIARACGVPVASSALEQIPTLLTTLPSDKTVGILTISAASLSRDHLDAAHVPTDVPVQGLDGSSFARTILENRTELHTAAAQAEMVEAARTLCLRHPQVAALVLECTNMPPYAEAVAHATGRPVYSILSYLSWFHSGLVPR